MVEMLSEHPYKHLKMDGVILLAVKKYTLRISIIKYINQYGIQNLKTLIFL